MRTLKIIFSFIVIFLIAIAVVRSCKPFPISRTGDKTVHEYRRTAPERVLPSRQPIPVASGAAAPKMAIILDDWGNNDDLLPMALDLQRPLTLAILPHLPQSKKIAEAAHERGLAVILHMPMQPAKTGEKLEPQTISPSLSDEMILEYLRSGLKSIPYLEGMNNHMGSAATADRRVMRTVLKEIKAQNIYFIDSNTSSGTVGWKMAIELGVPTAKRDIFIDNLAKKEEIKKAVGKAIAHCLKNKRTIVIGHDRKPTLQALAEMIPKIESSGIQLVFVRELLY